VQSSIGHSTQGTKGMFVRNPLLGVYVAEHVQLLLVFSMHVFFLSACVVETREFLGAGLASEERR